jgi:hypothetical protein
VLAALLMVAACGGSPTPEGSSVSAISVQPGDLPGGMQRCALSGDINTFLNNIKTKEPAIYTNIKAQWEAAQSKGATAAQAVFYTDSVADCAKVNSDVSGVYTAAYPVVVNYVFEFKDEATAATAYTSGSIFGTDPSKLTATGAPATQGTKTGLGANSAVVSTTIANQSFYIAVWQKKEFMVILGIINLDTAAGQKAADAENRRIP